MSIVFSDEVERAIAEVCPPRDAFDARDFDPVEYLNSRFPTESSLSALPVFLDEATSRLRQAEADLLRAVEAQAATADTTTTTTTANVSSGSSSGGGELRSIQGAVAELYARVSDIKAKASESESTVQTLCQHIRELDTAKTNLTTSITTLRSMQLWMLQLQALSTSFERKKYAQCRDALQEAKKYAAMFAAMADVPKVREMTDKQEQLCRQMEFYIRNTVFGQLDLDAVDEAAMTEACAIVDLMDSESVRRLREKFIDKALDTYTLRFRRGTEDARLERTERRYVYIRHLLEQYDSLFRNVFPRHWCVPQELCLTFCLRTKQELDHQLREAATSGSMDVVVLMYVLQKTIDIERDLTHAMAWTDEAFARQHALPVYRYNGLIVAAFKEHLYLFVRNEDKLMADALAQPLIGGVSGTGEAVCAGWDGGDDVVRVGVVLPMSEDVFVFIKESLKRSLRMAQPEVLLEMAQVWRRHLLAFASALTSLLPLSSSSSTATAAGGGGGVVTTSTMAGAGGGSSSSSSSTTTVPLSPLELRRVCILVNTAELCRATSQDLGGEVCARCEAPAKELAFDDVVEAFSTLYSKSVQCIVQSVARALAPLLSEYTSGSLFHALLRQQQRASGGGGGGGSGAGGGDGGSSGSYYASSAAAVAAAATVQDESQLVRVMRSHLHDVVLQCAVVLPSSTLRFVLDKMAVAVVPRYTSALYRLRRVPDEGVSQLRVDAAALEKAFLQLPNYNDPERFSATALSGYMRLVRREFDRLQRALKVLQADVRSAAFAEVYVELTLPEDRSIQHFVRLCELKGLRREDVRPAIAALSRRGVVEATRSDRTRDVAMSIAVGGGGSDSGGGGGAAATTSAAAGGSGNNTASSGGGGGGALGLAALFARDTSAATATSTSSSQQQQQTSGGVGGFSLSNFVNTLGVASPTTHNAAFAAAAAASVSAPAAATTTATAGGGGGGGSEGHSVDDNTLGARFASAARNTATSINIFSKFKKSSDTGK